MRLAKITKKRYIYGFDLARFSRSFLMLSTRIDSAFSIPLSVLDPRQITGESDVGVGFHCSGRFVGDQANAALGFLAGIENFRDSDWPLVLSGPAGTGKTALGLSVASRIVSQTGLPAAVFSADGFRRRFASAIDTNSIEKFHAILNSASLLMVDNLHLLSGYDAIQEELATLLDDFSDRQLPVVFTTNEKYLEPDCLDHRLVSRLSTGLCLNVTAPGFDARLDIVNDCGEKLGLSFDESALSLLGSELKLTYPKIHSFLASMSNWLRNNNRDLENIDRKAVSEYLKACKSSNYKIIDFIISEVANSYQLKLADIKSNSRKQTIVTARGVAIYLLRNTLGLSFAKIGEIFGGRDHSTIMHAAGKISDLLDSDVFDLRENIERIQRNIQEQGILETGVIG